MADPGSVLFNFARQGLVMVAPGAGEDAVFEAAMDAGAADIQQALGDAGEVVGFKVGRSRQRGWGGGRGAEFSRQQRRSRSGHLAVATAAQPRAPCSARRCSPTYPTSQPTQVLTAVEDYGAVSSSLAEQGLAIQPEASGLVYVPLVQQVRRWEEEGGRRGACACVQGCVVCRAGGLSQGPWEQALCLPAVPSAPTHPHLTPHHPSTGGGRRAV